MDKKDYILSIETSGHICGIALSDNDGNIIAKNLDEKNIHDKMLAEMVRQLLIDFDITFEQLSAVAVSGGPGSFTGLRIGVALAKGICFDKNIKFIPVDTLSSFAYHIITSNTYKTKRKISVVIHSHKDMYYIQDFSTNFDILSDVVNLELNDILKKTDDSTLLCGPGAFKIADHLDSVFDKWDLSMINITDLKAEYIDLYARKLYNDNFSADAISYIPNYFQNFVPKTHSEKT